MILKQFRTFMLLLYHSSLWHIFHQNVPWKSLRFQGFKLLDEFKERLNQEVALIQNQDEFQKFSKVYIYINQKKDYLNS